MSVLAHPETQARQRLGTSRARLRNLAPELDYLAQLSSEALPIGIEQRIDWLIDETLTALGELRRIKTAGEAMTALGAAPAGENRRAA